MERRGLLVFVYRSDLGDCTAGGVTAKGKSLKLVDQEIKAPFRVEEGEVYLELERFYSQGRILFRAIPMVDGHKVYTKEGVTMFGGNFIYTSDSRFPSDYPIPVHDRFEDWETFHALSV